MSVYGSGKYVGISNNSVWSGGSIIFGIGDNPSSCAVGAQYDYEGQVDTDSCIVVASNYVGLPNLSALKINGYTGYTGSITVYSHTYEVSIEADQFGTTTYNFKCGLLMNTFS